MMNNLIQLNEGLQTVLEEAELLYTQAQVSQAMNQMAAAIDERLHADHPLCLSVMLGGMIFTGQLLPRLNFPLELDYIHATRYHRTTQGSPLEWVKYPSVSLKGRTVLILDDILDEGITLAKIVEYCQQAGAYEVLTAVLVQKELTHRAGLKQADFVGLTVPNRYVFGCGMDYHGEWRHVYGIYAVKDL